MSDRTEPADATISADSVSLTSEEYRCLRRSSGILSRTTLRKKLRWLEYANAGQTPPVIEILDRDDFVLVDIDPIHATRKTFEIPRTTELRIDGEQYDSVLYSVWVRVREPERVKKVYSVEMAQHGTAETYVVRTVNLETGSENDCVVRTASESDPIPTTTADFRLYPEIETDVFDE